MFCCVLQLLQYRKIKIAKILLEDFELFVSFEHLGFVLRFCFDDWHVEEVARDFISFHEIGH